MALCMISYDVTEPDAEEYEPLWARLRMSGSKRVLYSQCAVKYEDPVRLFDEIVKLLRKDDGLIVEEMTRTVNWQNLRLNESEFRQMLRDARNY